MRKLTRLSLGNGGKIVHGSHGADCVRLIMEARMPEYRWPPLTLPRAPGGHEANWIRPCREGTPASSRFEYRGASIEMVLLGMVAIIRAGDQRLERNSANMRLTNNDQSNKLLHIRYHDGRKL